MKIRNLVYHIDYPDCPAIITDVLDYHRIEFMWTEKAPGSYNTDYKYSCDKSYFRLQEKPISLQKHRLGVKNA